MEKLTKEQLSTPIQLAESIVRLLDEKQARRIKLIKVEERTSLANYFVICEGRSSTHVNSLADELTEKLKEAENAPLHSDGNSTGTWVAIDFASVIVHIFDRSTREFYNLENLWKDGEEIDIASLLAPTGIGE